MIKGSYRPLGPGDSASTRTILPWTAAILAALTVFAQEPDRIDALIAQLGDPDSNVRVNAVNALGRLALPVELSNRLLVELLQDESYFVRWQALAALPASSAAVPNLIAALR